MEDPVEYQLAGSTRSGADPDRALSFARALRAILRRDPDIIMIGEMRDTETAQIGVQSALTTATWCCPPCTPTPPPAPSPGWRIWGRALSHHLRGQRRAGPAPGADFMQAVQGRPRGRRDYIEQTGLRRFVSADTLQVFQARGCAACNQTGYAGRTGIHELFVLDDEMHRVIMSGADATLRCTPRPGAGAWSHFTKTACARWCRA